MSAGTLYDAGAPAVEVRVYDHDRLLAREHCESEDDAAAVVERWSEVANLFVVADDRSSKHGPEDSLAPEAPHIGSGANFPLASTPLPGRGTE